MPAIIVEDAAINYTSTVASQGAPTVASDLSHSYPTYLYPMQNDSDDFWTSQLPTDDSIYQDIASTFFGYFKDTDDNFGSPMPFDASEGGLWNGRFVPPPPRPPFLEDSIIADGITTCDLCSWAGPTKSTFIFDETIEKASALGWPLTVLIVAVISAFIGAMLMIIIVRYRRKKTSNRNDTNTVQWWSRNKQRQHTQSFRRNNIYTGNPADSIRGLPNIHQNQRRNGNHHHNNNNNHETESCNWPNVSSFVVNS